MKHHIPTARAGMATNMSDALRQLAHLHMPVVVKPRIGSNSRHTTKFIQTEEQFKIAFKTAQQLCRYVVFEEFLTGEVSRATVVGGNLVGFLQTKQPSVTGDGIQTLQQLIDQNDTKRPEGVAPVTIAGENEAYIKRQGYELHSIPQKGTHIIIGRFGGRFSGGETHEMPRDVHPKLRAWVEKTAQLMNAPLVGFDLIIGDPSADPDTQVWGILEANTVPYIDIHTDPLYGTPSNVAAAVWDLWEKAK
jgi:cyanophycin synthetase